MSATQVSILPTRTIAAGTRYPTYELPSYVQTKGDDSDAGGRLGAAMPELIGLSMAGIVSLVAIAIVLTCFECRLALPFVPPLFGAIIGLVYVRRIVRRG